VNGPSGERCDRVNKPQALEMEEELLIEAFYSKLCKPESTVIDIGANTGFHTKRFLELCPKGNVYAIEANPRHIDSLKKLASNPGLHVIEQAVVPSNYTQGESARFKISAAYHGRGGIAGMHIWEAIDPSIVFEEISVKSITFDRLLEICDKCPLFIKMDIEGPEYALIYYSSFLKDIAMDRLPYMALENSVHGLAIAGISFEQLCECLHGLGYSLLDRKGSAITSESQRRQSGQTVFLAPYQSSHESQEILRSNYCEVYS